TAELYDPTSGTFAATSDMKAVHVAHNAIVLPSKTVLIIGGGGAPEIYDPATGFFTASGSSIHSYQNQTATLLASGLVLVAGGYPATNSASLYDRVTQATTMPTATLITSRELHTATLLPSGNVLLAGGDIGASPTPTAELFDATYVNPVTHNVGRFVATSPL